MRTMRARALVLATMFGVGALLMLLQLFGQAPGVMAREKALTGPEGVSQAPAAKPDYDISWKPVPSHLLILDSSGIALAGTYGGELKCIGDNCTHKMSLELADTVYEYRFSTRQALDLLEERVIVAGVGTATNERQKEKFSFVATFEINIDGTVWSRYDASRLDASFVIPKASGPLEVRSR